MGLREVLASGNGKDESRNRWRQIRLRERGVLAMAKPHHDQQASDDENPTEHGGTLPSNMLLLNLTPLIDVTFSTPTPHYTQYKKAPTFAVG